jgi:glycosyltransferase involved in cell wall biosynthesis
MRVLLVTDWAPTEGGIETYLVRLRAELVRAGDDVRLLASSAGTADRGLADYVARASDNPFLLAGLQLDNPFAASTLRRAVREFRPELVFVNMFERYLSPTVLRPPGHTPVVAMVHYYKPVCPTALKLLPGGEACSEPPGGACLRHGCVSPVEWLRDQPRYAAIWSGLRRADSVLACSRWVARELAGCGIEASPLHPPVPAPGPGYRRERAPEPVLLYVGRLVPEKGSDLLVRAFALAAGAYPRATLRLAGDGPQRAELARLAGELGIGASVELLGRLPFARVEAELARAWALVAPSRWAEPFGLAAVEAVTRGVPVVASAAGGHAETLEAGSTALLVRNGDVAELAAALDSILAGRAFASGALPADAVERARHRHAEAPHTEALRAVFAAVAEAA